MEEICPWCNMEIEPQRNKILDITSSEEGLSRVIQYRCPICGKIYRRQEIYEIISDEIIPEPGMTL